MEEYTTKAGLAITQRDSSRVAVEINRGMNIFTVLWSYDCGTRGELHLVAKEKKHSSI